MDMCKGSLFTLHREVFPSVFATFELMNRPSPRSLYFSDLPTFLSDDPSKVLGQFVPSSHGPLLDTTTAAWKGEIELLQRVLTPWQSDQEAYILFEYDIPRLGKRIDTVLLLRGIVFCLEFKVGQSDILQADVEQVLDYALDLKNFHLYSQDKPIAPILIPTRSGAKSTRVLTSVYDDGVFNPLITGAAGLQETISDVVDVGKKNFDPNTWGRHWQISPYMPTPTIIEAARSLYATHSVADITRHEAGKESTDSTIDKIMEVIEHSQAAGEKSICFVTGVPGAGKTLVGLDVAARLSRTKDQGAVYLSGNGPLVAVLTEALARDSVARGKESKISEARRKVSGFIQIIHRYRDNMLAKIKTPIEDGKLEIDPQKAEKMDKSGYGEVEHVVIFDEAQRSWTKERLANYLKRGGTYGNKLKVDHFPLSEAAFLIWSVDRRQDWAVIICLVGGGQEINTGEGGITEWLDAVNEVHSHWHVHISDQLTAKEYAEGDISAHLGRNPSVTFSDRLHLAVSRRSFRAERLSDFVQALLALSPDAPGLYHEVTAGRYPLYLTRHIDTAREWLRQSARGSERTGILVTKVAARYKPQAVSALAQGNLNAVHWFLEDKDDVRSSAYLEEAATEIQVQGLELDYACVLWDADMRYEKQEQMGKWGYYKFNGRTRWTPERNPQNQKYMLNAYRVLLTRARQGIIICIPEGNKRYHYGFERFPEDGTRLPQYYDGTYDYLKGIGIREIPGDMKRVEVAAAILLFPDGTVLAAQRGSGEWQGWWEFPGGKVEPGETPEEAVRRELLEELAVEIEVETKMTTVEYDYPAFHLTMHCFLCRLRGDALTLREHRAVRRLSPDQFDSVSWLPADRTVLPLLREASLSHPGQR